MTTDTVLIPLGYSHNVLWLCHLATFFTTPQKVAKWQSQKTL